MSADSIVFGEMGPNNLVQSLEPIWPPDRQHIPIEDIRDWFASYVYMPRLRDEATLEGALQRLVEDMADPYAYASGFDEDAGTYDGVIDGKARLLGDLGGELLVRRDATQSEGSEPVPDDTDGMTQPPDGSEPNPAEPDGETTPAEPLPRRFFASIPIEPERAGMEVARIMDGLLVELTRTQGSNLRLTLEIDGTTVEQGYPKDVVETVKANARDLKLEENSFGFEED